MNPKLTLLVSIITFFVVSTLLGLVLSFFGLESFSYRGGEQNTTFIGWFTVLIGLIVAIRLHWYLRGESKANINFENKLGLKYFLYGSIAWVVMIYLGSLINVQPSFVEQILGFILSIILIYIFYSNYQSKIAQINHQIRAEELKKIKEEENKTKEKNKLIEEKLSGMQEEIFLQTFGCSECRATPETDTDFDNLPYKKVKTLYDKSDSAYFISECIYCKQSYLEEYRDDGILGGFDGDPMWSYWMPINTIELALLDEVGIPLSKIENIMRKRSFLINTKKDKSTFKWAEND